MRVGLIGAGFMGRVHARVARHVPAITLVGYVDPGAPHDHPDLDGLRRHDSLDALIASRIDGVIVAVPDALHVPTARHCLDHGLSVLLEKPAAQNLAECVSLENTPDVHTRLLVGHHRRHHPAARRTREVIDAGRLGRLVGVNGVFALKKDDTYFVERPRGVGLVNLIHDLDLMQSFCGPISYVSAAVSHRARGAAEEDTIALTMAFASGVVGSFLATDSAPSPWGWDQATTELPSIPFDAAGTAYALLGTAASLAVPDMRLFTHRPGEAWHQPLVHETVSAPGTNAYVNQLAHFADVMTGAARPTVGLTEAIATQAALEAIFLSARTGQRVDTAALIAAARAANVGASVRATSGCDSELPK